MKKLESSLTNMVIVLVGVAIISALLLAAVNHATEATIAEQDKITLANGIKAVMGTDQLEVTADEDITLSIPAEGKDYSFIVHRVSDVSGQFLGAAVESTTMGFGGDLKVLVGFDAEGSVLGYTILAHSETPGLGAKADAWFQADGKGSIIGRNLSEGTLTVSKDGGDVDAITASTITTRAFLKAVNYAYAAYADQEVDATSGATSQAN